MLVDRSVAGPAAWVGGHSTRIITPPSRHESILSYVEFSRGQLTGCGLPTLSSGSISDATQRGDSVTGPIEESVVATVGDWADGLAPVLTGAADQARAAVAEFSGPETVGDYLGVSYEDPNSPFWWPTRISTITTYGT